MYSCLHVHRRHLKVTEGEDHRVLITPRSKPPPEEKEKKVKVKFFSLMIWFKQLNNILTSHFVNGTSASPKLFHHVLITIAQFRAILE